MFRPYKRFICLLLMLAALISLATSLAAAQEITEEDTYTYERNAITNNILYHYSATSTIQYSIIKNGVASPGVDSIHIYNMKNNTAGKDILTYCTDIATPAVLGHTYRRLNLEDSSFSASAAGLIRAILTHGFYFTEAKEDITEHNEMVYAKVAELAEAANIPDLHVSEAIAGTQVAIWKAAHGPLLSFDLYARYLSKVTNTKYADLCNKNLDDTNYYQTHSTKLDAVSNNIKTLSDYLLTLTPIGPNEKVVSPASFTKLNNPIFTPNDDGTYKMDVTLTVNVNMASGDSLQLQAQLGNRTSSASLNNGSQTLTLSIDNVDAALIDDDVTLSISGLQTVGGYFYFDAKGDREASQNMVGYERSRTAVYAEVVAEKARVLNIQKTTNGSFPLKGIAFDVYYIASMADFQSGKYVLKDNPADDKPSDNYADFTLITDAQGKASLNLTQHGLGDGVYLMVEHKHDSIIKPIDPFYVVVPMPGAADNGYTISIQPKNEIKGKVSIEKDVIELGNDRASVDAALPHTWIISASVPHDLSTGSSYQITDTLDHRLDYIGNIKVRLESTEDAAVDLVKDVDYTLEVTDVATPSQGNSDSFAISLTKAGMNKIATLIGKNNYSDYRIRVYFDAQINSNATMGTDIPNKAKVEYVNTFDFTFRDTSDEPVVNTGGANLLKVDGDNHQKILPGAVFEVYRKATDEELADSVTLPGVAEPVVKVLFYNNAALTGEAVSNVTTDKNGLAAIYGLAYGTYYLLETLPPTGYNPLEDATVLVIDATSHTDEQVVLIENNRGIVLPETGGMGTALFTASGLMLMFSAGILLWLSKRRAF